MQAETRTAKGLSLRAVEGRTLPTIVGRPIVFGVMSEPLREFGYGEFREIVRPSFADSLSEAGVDVRALVDHDSGKVIGRSSAGTLRYEIDREGVTVEIDPPDTTHGRDIVESVRRGDIDGMSFAFRVAEDGDTIREEDGQTIRELVKSREIPEFSIVAWPAYRQTTVAVRSLSRLAEQNRRNWILWARRRLDLEEAVY